MKEPTVGRLGLVKLWVFSINYYLSVRHFQILISIILRFKVFSYNPPIFVLIILNLIDCSFFGWNNQIVRNQEIAAKLMSQLKLIKWKMPGWIIEFLVYYYSNGVSKSGKPKIRFKSWPTFNRPLFTSSSSLKISDLVESEFQFLAWKEICQ